MVGYSIAVVVLAWDRDWKVSILDGLLWLWPGYIVLVTSLSGVLLTPLALALASAVAWRQLRIPGRAIAVNSSLFRKPSAGERMSDACGGG
jgi:hypothetical protein